MASLRSIMLSGKIHPLFAGADNPTLKALQRRDTILVNAQSTFDSMRAALDREETGIGLGLFGKYKVLIWVDEHEAGEAALGTVVGSYRVE